MNQIKPSHHNQRYEKWEKDLMSMRFLKPSYLAPILGRTRKSISVYKTYLKKYPMSEEEVKQIIQDAMSDFDAAQTLGVCLSAIHYLKKYFWPGRGVVEEIDTQEYSVNQEPDGSLSTTIVMDRLAISALMDATLEASIEAGKLLSYGEAIAVIINEYLERRDK